MKFGRSIALAIAILALGGCSGARPIARPDELRVLIKAGQAREAYVRFDEAVLQEPENLSAHRGLVEAAYYAGRLEEIERRYRRAAERGEGVGHYGLGLIAAARPPGRLQEALAELNRAAERLPKEADVPYRKGLILLQAGRAAEAKAELERALGIDPGFHQARIALAGSLVELGEEKAVVDVLRPVVGQRLDAEAADRARRLAERVFDLSRRLPADAAAEAKGIADLFAREAPQAAHERLIALLERWPDAAFLYTLKGLCHARMGQNGEALVAFERSLELVPENPLALLGQGDVYAGLGRTDQARGCYERIIGQNPLEIDAYHRLAELALGLRDFAGAVRALELVVLLDPGRPSHLHALAKALTGAGRLSEAVGAYESILTRTESDLEALVGLARLHIVLGEREVAVRMNHRREARKLLARAEELVPDNEAVQELLATLED